MEPLENTTEEDKLTLFVEWLLANRLQVGLGVVIALVIGAYLTLQKTEALAKEEEAAEEMWGVIFPDVEVAGMSTNQPMVVQLDNISKKHTGTKAAANAQFLAASEFFDQGKYTEAAAAFTLYLGITSGGPLAAAAQFGLAASQDALGQKEKAQKGYEQIITQHVNAPEALQARVAWAKLLLVNSTPEGTDKARALLLAASQESQSARIPGFWGREAQRMLAPLQAEGEEGDNSEKEKSQKAEEKKPAVEPSSE
ncbi:MAG TPA: hypothetical protein DEB48_04820 [Verrucomicrobiales bacterium]|nr:hypothetical protein [Verrucomicrobiales bacterium]